MEYRRISRRDEAWLDGRKVRESSRHHLPIGMFCRLGRRKAMSKSNLGMGGVTIRLYLLYN